MWTNLAQNMHVLYSAEQKGRPLGSQALIRSHLNWAFGFVWSHLVFNTQSAPTRFDHLLLYKKGNTKSISYKMVHLVKVTLLYKLIYVLTNIYFNMNLVNVNVSIVESDF